MNNVTFYGEQITLLPFDENKEWELWVPKSRALGWLVHNCVSHLNFSRAPYFIFYPLTISCSCPNSVLLTPECDRIIDKAKFIVESFR